MPKLNVLVAGSTGYIGIQLIKLLNKHKYVKIKYLCGNTSVGKKISYYDKNKVYNYKTIHFITTVFIFTNSNIPNSDSSRP